MLSSPLTIASATLIKQPNPLGVSNRMKFIVPLLTALAVLTVSACSTGLSGSLFGATVGAQGTVAKSGVIVGGQVTANSDNQKH